MRVENGYTNRAGFVHDGDFAYKENEPGSTKNGNPKNGGFSTESKGPAPSRPGFERAPYVAVTPNNASRPPVSVVSPTTTTTDSAKDSEKDFPDNMTSTVASSDVGGPRDMTSDTSSVASSSSVYIGELEEQDVGVKYVHPRDQMDDPISNAATLPKDQANIYMPSPSSKRPAPAAPPASEPLKASSRTPSQVDISTRL